MASSHFYEGYRSNVSANRSGESSNFSCANLSAKKLSNPSSAGNSMEQNFLNATQESEVRTTLAPPPLLPGLILHYAIQRPGAKSSESLPARLVRSLITTSSI
jgi:hypothetical protein